MALLTLSRAGALLALACGCGLGGGEGGGDDNLPVSGTGPYRKLTDFELLTPLDEPFVISDPGADLDDPFVVEQPGGVLRVFYTRTPPGGPASIWRSDLASSLSEAPGAPVLVLEAAEGWEEGDVRAPTLVSDAAGLTMVYQGGAGALGRAVSTDGGETWTRSGRMLADATSPALLRIGDTTLLYFTRPSSPGIFVASTRDGLTWDERPEPVLAPRAGRFDEIALRAPHAAGGVPPAGGLHIALFYTGTSVAGVTAVGFAGSDDGATFIARPAPVLDPGAPSERAPAALLRRTSAVLFFAQDRAGRSAIAAATSP
jgi:hypothetical protein